MVYTKGRWRGRQLVVVIVSAGLCFESMPKTAAAQAPILEATRARVRALQASRDQIEITLVDRTTVRGLIIGTDDDSFTIGEEKTNRKVTLRYEQVLEVKRWRGPGFSRKAQTAITFAVAGAVLLVFCAAPFPLGFLCKQDRS